MKVLTKKDASCLFDNEDIDRYIDSIACKMRAAGKRYDLAQYSTKQLALANVLEYLFLEEIDVCLYVTDWGIYSDHLDLFYGYRSSKSEGRSLIEAPVHLFNKTEKDSLISILIMALYFSWDVWLFDLGGAKLVRFTHDGWLEIKTNGEDLFMDACSELDKVL